LENNKSDPWLRKLARGSAWTILVGIIVLLVSGWGITQTGVIYRLTGGLVDRRLADTIHRGTIAPLTFFFLLHVLLNIRLKISPGSKLKIWLTDAILMVIGGGLMAIAIYLEYFRLGG
jgi:cytochrome b subunit of formate dehydrogenase